MSTASAVQKTGSFLHVRGSWSACEDRNASAVWLGILWVGMIAGFGVDFPRYLHENPPAPKITYLHGAIFTGWMVLLTAQVLLVVGDRVKIHRTLGWVTAGWACLMAVFGPACEAAVGVAGWQPASRRASGLGLDPRISPAPARRRRRRTQDCRAVC